MPPDDTATPEGAATDRPLPEDAVNDQIRDAVSQLRGAVLENSPAFATAAIYQTIAHALGLAFHNAVAQQQHTYMLRNALTTAASTALLAGKTAEAEAVLKIAETRLATSSFADEVAQIQKAIHSLHGELQRFAAAAGAAPAAQD